MLRFRIARLRALGPFRQRGGVTRQQIAAADAGKWIFRLRAGAISVRALDREFASTPDWVILREKLRTGNKQDRRKAIIALCIQRRLRDSAAATSLEMSRGTYRKYRRLYVSGGARSLFKPRSRVVSKSTDEQYRSAVFELLHEPPSSHGINRTSWKFADMLGVLAAKGLPLGRGTLSQIIRSAGYKWRHARVALTSTDPAYREKLDHVRGILERLDKRDAFFSIDEYGPFAIKMKPGLALAAPGEQRIVPQFQKSKGCMIMTAALELSGNQVTHFYSQKKNTAEMIRMMEVLIERYQERRRIYLSWDAASWHISKKLKAAIEGHNASVAVLGGPIVEMAPLPAGAQFLNVIESVFSGMSRAIVHNSDYPTVGDAKKAIDRYFADRNAYFQTNPQRAGKRIWGKEREPACFSEANNCKDPRYR